MNKITLKKTYKCLLKNDYIYILCHNYPDGDTLGSAVGLYHILKQLDKKVKIICNMDIPEKFKFMFKNVKSENFEPKYIVSIDVADEKLLGDNLNKYKGKINLCIDHHSSNTEYAENLFVNSKAGACAEIITTLVKMSKLNVSQDIADALFTGISTDTGCFKYSNVTARTHKLAAYLIKNGANASEINRIMFDTKSKSRIQIEQIVMNNMRYFFNNRCALSYILKSDIDNSKANEGDLDGISSIPRQIEGVDVGIYIREKDTNLYKISLRTQGKVNASDICAIFDGGGHICAAGCEIKGSLEEVIDKITKEVKKQLV